MSEPIQRIETLEDGYLKRNFITIPTATAVLSLTEAMKLSMEVYQERKKKLEAYAKNPKADKALIREIDIQLRADAAIYNFALQLIDRLQVVEDRVSREFERLNSELNKETAENIDLLGQVIELRTQLIALKAHAAH